jgi:hypothetical protein
MSDLVDYMIFFIASLFMAVLNFTGFAQLDWWIVASPSIFALLVHMYLIIS